MIPEKSCVCAQLGFFLDFALNKQTPVFVIAGFGKEIYSVTQPAVNLSASHCSFMFMLCVFAWAASPVITGFFSWCLQTLKKDWTEEKKMQIRGYYVVKE